VMSHSEWDTHSNDLTDAFLFCEDEENTSYNAKIPVYVDQLTGLDGLFYYRCREFLIAEVLQ